MFSSHILAADLLTVYEQALANDPTFQVARAQWLADKQTIGIARGSLLPALDLIANYTYFKQSMQFQTNDYTQKEYSLTLTQPIFNFQAWSALGQAKANVKSSTATYSNSAQDLIYRTASSYLAVLQAEDVLRYTTAQREATGTLLDQTKQRFKVGLSTITDVQQAQASYDNNVSAEITAKNSLDVSKEQLREITGQYYQSLATLSKDLPLLTPVPNNIKRWVAVAEKQNYSLLAAKFNLQAAQENIKVQVGNTTPIINATGGYSYYDYDVNGGNDIEIVRPSSEVNAGINVSLPILRGGSNVAQIRQAKYNYQKAASTLEQTHRTVVSQTSQAFLGVISGISSVKAGRQSVISNRSALNSTNASYSVGVKTIVDVLLAESSLYQAQKDYAVAQYNYLTQMLLLKEQAGTLGFDDLRNINLWLKDEKVGIESIVKAGFNTLVSKPVPKYVSKTGKSFVVQQQTSKNFSVTENKILSANPRNYTIQLLAANNENKIITFVNAYNIDIKPIYIFKINKGGHVLYDLAVGNYSTIGEAKASKYSLLKSNKKLHPWIRTFSSIQSAIKSN